MKTFRVSLIIMAVCSLLIGSAPMTAYSTSALAVGTNDLSSETLQELARARGATAKYHDIAQAEADGYINVHAYESGEGFHLVKPSLVDGNFDPEQPEVLLYAPVPGENRLELVAVEYAIPLVLSSESPAGFTGDADVWQQQHEPPVWKVVAWIWLHNPTGIFTTTNPR